ncbi:MAG TPA: tRNA pseudouridine(38-40) synthase TruA [Syntrophorhabdales bacterium]|nr:tRNA pseudouridine(38-40) synthase TruA [Syntrophorhabdales bacterium]
MRNIALVLAYDGTNYHGWQRQPAVVTVEQKMGEALRRILNHDIKMHAGARTDSGVHAMGQVINFFTEKEIALQNLSRGLNSILPRDIRVMRSRDEREDFHARYSARRKTYVYCILNEPSNSPFLSRYVLHWPHALDIDAMKEGVGWVVGEHDFSAFKKKDELYKSTVREITQALVLKRAGMIYIILEGTGFLRYMVRTIAGTLILAGREKIRPPDIKEILESGERERAGETLPAHGLFLKKIAY